MSENGQKLPFLEGLTFHPEDHQVKRDGRTIQLRKKEYQLLEFLAKNRNKVINRTTLLEYVWNYSVHAMTNTLEVHISNLRRKIDGDYPAKMLQTIYGLGYKLCDSPDGQISPAPPPQTLRAQQHPAPPANPAAEPGSPGLASSAWQI
jgi:DNA-binding response OmpR family regulator